MSDQNLMSESAHLNADLAVVVRPQASPELAEFVRRYWAFDVKKNQFVRTDEELFADFGEVAAGGIHEAAGEAGHLELGSARCRTCQEPVTFTRRDDFSAGRRRLGHLARLGMYSCTGCIVPSGQPSRWRKGEEVEAKQELVGRLDRGCDFDSLPLRAAFALAALLSDPDMQPGGAGICMVEVQSKVGIPHEEFSSLYRSFAITVAPDGITTTDFAPRSRDGFNFGIHVPHIVNAWHDGRSTDNLLSLLRSRLIGFDQSLLNLWFECCELDMGRYLTVISAEMGITYDSETRARIIRAIKEGVSVLPMSQLWGLCRGVVTRAAKTAQGAESAMEKASREVPYKLWEGIERRVKAKSLSKGYPRPKKHNRLPVMEMFCQHYSLTETTTPSSVESRLVNREDTRWISAFMSSRYVSGGTMVGELGRIQYSGQLPEFFVHLKGLLELRIDLEDSIRMSVDAVNRDVKD